MNTYWQQFKTYWQRLPIESRGAIAVVIPLACLLGAVVADTLLRHKIITAQMYVDRTNQVLITSQSALISLLNAETGVRGYYIGKQKVFLTPYNQALTTLEPTLVGLEQLVQDHPSQLRQAKLLTQMAQDKMSLLQGTVQRVTTKVNSSSPEITERLLKGQQSMDRFRDAIDRFETEERRVLALHNRSLQEQQQLNVYAMWGGITIGIGGTALAIQLLRQLATELREREVRLCESRNLIQAIVTNVVDGVMILNTQGEIATFNNAAVTMFGYTPSEVIGWHWRKLLATEAETTQKLLFYAPDMMVAAIPTGQIWQAMGQRKNGAWFPIEVSISSIDRDDDRIAIVRDITNRQQAAATLEAKAIQMAELNASLTASNQSLQQSNRELEQFAYITSHDLKAPLRAIANLAEWIEEDLGASISTETRLHIRLLRGRVYRMQALLNGLLEYSRAGRRQHPITTVDLDCLLTGIIQTLAPPDTLTVIVSPMPTINTRRQPLQQVFTHLIDNAIRHHPTKMGIIEVSVVDRDDRYEFVVADDGDGIETQFQERIYTIFQTLKARDLQENIGAGLAIAKKVVTAEGGTIHLESAVGIGTVFRFTWLKQPIINKDVTTNSE